MKDFSVIREILGSDFISPWEIADARQYPYSVAQIAELKRTLPDTDLVEWLKQNDYMLMTGPPEKLSLAEVRDRNQKIGGAHV